MPHYFFPFPAAPLQPCKTLGISLLKTPCLFHSSSETWAEKLTGSKRLHENIHNTIRKPEHSHTSSSVRSSRKELKRPESFIPFSSVLELESVSHTFPSGPLKHQKGLNRAKWKVVCRNAITSISAYCFQYFLEGFKTLCWLTARNYFRRYSWE